MPLGAGSSVIRGGIHRGNDQALQAVDVRFEDAGHGVPLAEGGAVARRLSARKASAGSVGFGTRASPGRVQKSRVNVALQSPHMILRRSRVFGDTRITVGGSQSQIALM